MAHLLSCHEEKVRFMARERFDGRRSGGCNASTAAEPFRRARRSGARYSRPMSEVLDMAAVAALVGDPARANILCALLDGRALTAGGSAFCGHNKPPAPRGGPGELPPANP